MKKSWFIIANPTSGNKNFKKNWNEIQQLLNQNNIEYSFELTTHSGHEEKLVHQAIKKGFTQFISVGGDGTLHHVTNGIMSQKTINPTDIILAVIPLGTGNDWVKNYHIEKDFTKNITYIKQGKTLLQDIGMMEVEGLLSSKKRIRYFNILGGIGYDAYVVHKLNKLKRFGSIAYLLSGIIGLLSYRKSKFKIEINQETIETTCLMTVFGNCKYTGGGMRLADYTCSRDGLFDVSVFKHLTFFDLLIHMRKLYTGAIVYHQKVATYKTKKITVTPLDKNNIPFVQADGELIGKGKVTATVLPKALNFIVP